ncbi:MAG: dihydroorotate dehydrogenase (quinone) [Candidatus Taylorbacteria bacterium RIFCSPHIGHO2_01_FULL_45_63]|uniref:Dihydroorotate dehydrogenase (quinone) n=1 Tax=Candidatus Taylorbacteria bacterium RIFCSPHIGHO2_02_FULL_45_35 TaxID=1802311 RepID=A0A1G2MTC6_9BACT|nr:MAG: dihydroorotate dehydrogenase (quinone) [Candidatus Taylorbacteria bacterium RIFCSPHIGHO2_01_FULL_45_63]OHA27137.1 MAG: dihydroorotate dehydrogenase (quinone) [Candidatus Taylorbacteria bacterium RIFCSPHIGHO2_02_FULL_45_35]
MFYKKVICPLLFATFKDAEKAHGFGLKTLRILEYVPGALPIIGMLNDQPDETLVGQKLFGLYFNNPVGLAAGMDKNAVALPGFQALGFGFLEIGGVTTPCQIGNPTPRLFRLEEDEAIINRMGFNNDGSAIIAERLKKLRETEKLKVPVGVNIGKSKDVPIDDIDAVCANYRETFETLCPYADFFVINVSSPNTPNLRKLQGVGLLEKVVFWIQKSNDRMPRRPGEQVKPVLIKIAPDLEDREILDVLESVENGRLNINGIVATNTTLARPSDLKSKDASQTGGLSGVPLRKRALHVVSLIREHNGKIPIIGVGGISSGADAWNMILCGANLVQLYTGLVYEGPSLVGEIQYTIAKHLRGLNKNMTTFHPRVHYRITE